MKFLVPNYSCLQNPWLGGYRPQIPILSVLSPQLNLLNPPPPKKIPVYSTVQHCQRAEGEWECQTSGGWMEWWGMRRGWELEIGGTRPRTEMVGGEFLSRPRPCMGCSAWEWVSEFFVTWVLRIIKFLTHMIRFPQTNPPPLNVTRHVTPITVEIISA